MKQIGVFVVNLWCLRKKEKLPKYEYKQGYQIFQL